MLYYRAALSVSVCHVFRLFLWLPWWDEVRTVQLWMHTSAQRLTGADSMKGEAAEINTYVMRWEQQPNGLGWAIMYLLLKPFRRVQTWQDRHLHDLSQSERSFLHYRKLFGSKVAVGKMTHFTCQNQNQTGAARLSAGLLRFVTVGKIKRALKDAGSSPADMGFIHNHTVSNMSFHGLIKKKKEPDCALRVFRDVVLWHQPVRTLGNMHTSAARHPCGHVRWSHLFHQAGCRMSPDDI